MVNQAESYKDMNDKYLDLRDRMDRLEILRDKAAEDYYGAGHYGTKERRALYRIEEQLIAYRAILKEITNKLLVLEYIEKGTAVTKLVKKYRTSLKTAKELLAQANIVYFKPEMVRWLPFGTVKKDGSRILALWANDKDHVIIEWDKPTKSWMQRAAGLGADHGYEDYMFSHWMPLPKIPTIEGKKDV